MRPPRRALQIAPKTEPFSDEWTLSCILQVSKLDKILMVTMVGALIWVPLGT